jgi:hypothetical protein
MLENLMTMVSELVDAQSASRSGAQNGKSEFKTRLIVSIVTAELQEGIMKAACNRSPMPAEAATSVREPLDLGKSSISSSMAANGRPQVLS